MIAGEVAMVLIPPTGTKAASPAGMVIGWAVMLLMALFVVTLIIVYRQADRRRRALWEQYARERGFRYQDGRIDGAVKGVSITVALKNVAKARSIEVSGRSLSPVGATFQVTLPSPRLGRQSVDGLRLVEGVGDPAFDATFMVTADDPRAPNALLDANVRREALAFAARFRWVWIGYASGAVALRFPVNDRLGVEPFDAAAAVVSTLCRAQPHA